MLNNILSLALLFGQSTTLPSPRQSTTLPSPRQSTTLPSPLAVTAKKSPSFLVHQRQVRMNLPPSFAGILDPFDTSDASLCWKRRNCTTVPSEDIPVFSEDGDYLDEARDVTTCVFMECPAEFPTVCGLGCAKSTKDCQADVYSQISSAVEVAYNIGQIFMAIGSSAPSTASGFISLSALGKWAREAAERIGKSALQHYFTAKVGKEAAEKLAEQIMGHAMGQNNTIDWTSADPTGVSALVKAFWKPICKAPN